MNKTLGLFIAIIKFCTAKNEEEMQGVGVIIAAASYQIGLDTRSNGRSIQFECSMSTAIDTWLIWD